MNDQAGNEKTLDNFAQDMKRDWNHRARENARWFINTVRLDQSEDEFDKTGGNEINALIAPELSLMTQGRDPKSLRFLEIGCGIGRMTKHLASIFGEVHATDVSGEMIAQARERLRHLPNARLYETSGVDFAALPDNYFDIAFSAYVFQHMPSKDVIRSNILEAYRVVKPGGLLKFHANGVESQIYESTGKDTWAGATFTEGEMRALAREIGAQLISIYGAKTMYCWMTMRKPVSPNVSTPSDPMIEFHARADDATIRSVPAAGDDAWLSLVVRGLDPESVDANNLKVLIDGRPMTPRYVGRIRPHFESELSKHFGSSLEPLVYVETPIPTDVGAGVAHARIGLENGASSPAYAIRLEDPIPVAPIIVTVRNGDDYGTDIHSTGPKSSLRLFVEGLDETSTCENVSLKAGGRILRPTFVGYVVDIAGYQIDADMPADLGAGQIDLILISKGIESKPVSVDVKDA
jgi:SAM-dependent methyltransferase